MNLDKSPKLQGLESKLRAARNKLAAARASGNPAAIAAAEDEVKKLEGQIAKGLGWRKKAFL